MKENSLFTCGEEELTKFCFENITMSSNNPEIDRKAHTFILNSIFGKNESASNTLDSPLKILWKITGKCNAKCRHCWAKLGCEHSHDEIMRLADEICENNVFMVSLSGGEPFLRNDLLNVVERLKANNIIIDIMTNGSLINEENAEQLSSILNLETDVIQVSLDGPNSDVHDSQRNVAIFDDAINGIKLLKQRKIKVRCVCTATPINVKYIYETYKLANSLGVDVFAPAPVFPLRRGKQFKNQLDEMEYLRQIAACKSIESNMHTKLRIQFGKCYQFLVHKYFESINSPIFQETVTRKVCMNETNAFMQIDAEGDALPGPEWEHDVSAGNVYIEGLMSIWQKGTNWEEFRNGRRLFGTYCSECKVYNICRGGNAKYAHDAYGTINMPDAACMLVKKYDLR